MQTAKPLLKGVTSYLPASSHVVSNVGLRVRNPKGCRESENITLKVIITDNYLFNEVAWLSINIDKYEIVHHYSFYISPRFWFYLLSFKQVI